MQCDSLLTHRNTFFDDLEEIVPSFSSKNVDEKFSFYNGKIRTVPVYALQISV